MDIDYISFLPSDDINLSHVAELFKALGDETRIRILWSLVDGEMCVNELAEQIAMTKSAVSHQLRELRMTNLVKNRRDGKQIYYSLKNKRIERFLHSVVEFTHSMYLKRECSARTNNIPYIHSG